MSSCTTEKPLLPSVSKEDDVLTRSSSVDEIITMGKDVAIPNNNEVVKPNKTANSTKSFSSNTVDTLSTLDDTYKSRMNQFDRFNDGNVLDEESFNSVFPEIISQHIAKQCMGMKVIIDPFCGAGRNVIQLARVCDSDCIVTSPPWGGPIYKQQQLLSPKNILVDKILELGIKLAPKILLHMPKNLNTTECIWIGKNYKIRTYKEETIKIN
ncbi:trimethylguanosine synthase-like [Melanaphis sacchari]|uniref:trimethylguanosine synthase-like n=1 Tax=Melanaphis sacchari TaxID=742174 RepID=UPI000DC13D9E|nr:trimethylguanosine synthase-like [Melanaphis sacchari]